MTDMEWFVFLTCIVCLVFVMFDGHLTQIQPLVEQPVLS